MLLRGRSHGRLGGGRSKVDQSLVLGPGPCGGHQVLGFIKIFTKRAAEGIAECEHALALNRNLASAHAWIGLGKTFIGRAEEAEAHVSEALRLSPRDPYAYAWKTFAGDAKNQLGSWDQAVAWCRRAIEANRNYSLPYFELAIAFAQLGRFDEARSAAKAGLALDPAFTIARTRAAWTAFSDDPTYLGQLESMFDGLRKAGLPEE
jgi:tetratricopeptide (TPR) repeat protein